jgi:hypothetical protein
MLLEIASASSFCIDSHGVDKTQESDAFLLIDGVNKRLRTSRPRYKGHHCHRVGSEMLTTGNLTILSASAGNAIPALKF